MPVEKKNMYVGHRYVPKIFGEWNQLETYEGLSIVTYQGNSYTSKKRVPVGIPISNVEYWVVTGNYNAQIEQYRQDVERVEDDLLDATNDIDGRGVNLVNFDIISDGVTDQTSKILNLFTNELLNFKGTIVIPYNTKFNITEVFSKVPASIVIDDKSLINMGYSAGYKQKYLNIGGSDLVDNDFLYQIISGHHPALMLNNLGTSGSDSADLKRGSILYGHGFNDDGSQKTHMLQQSQNNGSKWLWTIRALKKFLTGESIDSTIFMLDEDGRMGINGLRNYHLASFSNSSLNPDTTTQIGMYNTNNNSTTLLQLGSKDIAGLDINVRLYILANGTTELRLNGEALFSGSKDAFRSVKPFETNERFQMNHAKTIAWKNLSGVNPTVSSGTDFNVDNATPTIMTDMVGVGNQEVRLLFKNGNTTLKNGLLRLEGGLDWTPTTNCSITFVKNPSVSSAWIEVSRKIM